MRKKEALRPCPICRSSTVEVLHHQRFALLEGHILPDAFDVVWCERCGMAYADTPASQETYDAYYAGFSKYEDNATSTGGGGAEFDARRLRETAAAIAAIVGDRGARIADIGCANGGLLGELKTLGFDQLLGVDPSPACAANARRTYGIEAVAGSIRELPAGCGTFDLIILSHVLEHVAELQETVADLTRLLRPDGRCYVEVPDAARYREYLLAPFQDFNTEHINHFSLSSLRNLFRPHGFVAEASGQKEIESSPGCPYPAAYIFFRKSKPTTASPEYEVDHAFRENLLDYIGASRAKLEVIEQQLAPLRQGEAGLMVWGTGQLAMKLMAESSLREAKIRCFIDSNPIHQGKKLLGIPIVAPTEVTDRETPILLATLLHQDEITDAIRNRLRLPNPLIALSG